MAIITGITDIAKLNIWKKKHDFSADAFKMALYTSSATLNSSTTVYSATNECAGAGYVAGGIALTNVTPIIVNGEVLICWTDPASFGVVTIPDIRGALIYNTSYGPNEAVFVWDFGQSIARVAALFAPRLPQSSNGTGVIKHR